MSTEERTFDLAVNSTAGAIASNISELKSYIESVTQPYIGQVITEDQAKFAKKDLASLRKLQTALEDERKRVGLSGVVVVDGHLHMRCCR